MTALSGGAPEQAPRWDLVDTESCGCGIWFLALSPIVWGDVDIYIGGRSTSVELRGAHVVGGRAYPPGRALHPRGPPVAPPTYFFLLYIPTYPQTTRYGAKNLIPPPQLSVSTRSHLGACPGAPLEGAAITEGFYITPIATPMMCE